MIVPIASRLRTRNKEILILYSTGVRPCSATGPNAHNQIGPRATAACVKLCGLDNSLANNGRLAVPFNIRNSCLKSGPLRGPQNLSSRATFGPLATGCAPLLYSSSTSPTLLVYVPTLSLCARNIASMGRIDQSHAQKASGVTTSIHFVISRPGTN